MKMVNFELNVKDEIFNMTRAWDKEKSESPTGIEPMTSRTPGGRSDFSLSHAHVMFNISLCYMAR